MSSKYYAILATILYGVGIALAMLYGVVHIEPKPLKEAELFVEFIEPEPELSTESVAAPSPDVAPQHQTVAEQDNSQQTEGKAAQTQTVNPRALFKMNQGGVDNEQNSGNPYAQASEKDSSAGSGAGLNPVGTDALDEGLQGRGLVGALPMPAYPAGNRGGKVVVRVSVDKLGKVTSATYEPKGSTTSDSSLVEAAIAAAKRARFTESAAFVQGGTITYIFKLKQ
ncbi:MAG: TonB family protein [Rikenellaceae bacterium]|nr:TonB family protein [Rikenellaceae bacterium]